MNHFWQICETYCHRALKAYVTIKLMSAELMHHSAQQSILKRGDVIEESTLPLITTDCTEQSVQLITFAALYPFWDCHEGVQFDHATPQEDTVYVIWHFKKWQSMSDEGGQVMFSVHQTFELYVQWLVSQQSLWLSCWGDCTTVSCDGGHRVRYHGPHRVNSRSRIMYHGLISFCLDRQWTVT